MATILDGVDTEYLHCQRKSRWMACRIRSSVLLASPDYKRQPLDPEQSFPSLSMHRNPWTVASTDCWAHTCTFLTQIYEESLRFGLRTSSREMQMLPVMGPHS